MTRGKMRSSGGGSGDDVIKAIVIQYIAVEYTLSIHTVFFWLCNHISPVTVQIIHHTIFDIPYSNKRSHEISVGVNHSFDSINISFECDYIIKLCVFGWISKERMRWKFIKQKRVWLHLNRLAFNHNQFFLSFFY